MKQIQFDRNKKSETVQTQECKRSNKRIEERAEAATQIKKYTVQNIHNQVK